MKYVVFSDSSGNQVINLETKNRIFIPDDMVKKEKFNDKNYKLCVEFIKNIIKINQGDKIK